MDPTTRPKRTDQSGSTGFDAASDKSRGNAHDHILDPEPPSQTSISTLLREEVVNIKADLASLLGRIPFLSNPDMANARNKLVDRVSQASRTVARTSSQARQKVGDSLVTTRTEVRKRPISAMGVALGVGVLAGALVKRRGRRG
ncbi:hypothetical protein BH11PSE11_BH11PSE11_21200 [soil metagenome]